MGSRVGDLINLFDYERAAGERLDAGVLGYYRSGADDEVTLADNRAAWERLRLLPSVLVDVSARSLATTVLDSALDFPVLVAPMAMQAMAHPDGELATARAAGRNGTVMILSTVSNTAVEDVVAAATGPVWFQVYVQRDRGATRELVQRARDAGCRALVVTVDVPVLGRREADLRNRFALPAHLTLPHFADGGGTIKGARKEPISALTEHVAEQLDPSLDWADVEQIAQETDLPIVLKGILRADDARRAVDHGARAIVVSNHGGRQLDSVPAGADVLEGIVEVVGDRHEVLVDGGIRRGTDVIKALALGARAVLLGRPVLWGLAVDGEDGAARVLSLLRAELDTALALCGCPSVRQVSRDLVR